MTNRQPLRHMIIFLPGIMGSTLQKDGKDVWALSGVPLWQYLKALRLALGGSVYQLAIKDDDWRRDDLGDGVVATSIINDLHSVPGVVQHSGYSTILNSFPQVYDRVIIGNIDQPQDNANYYPFPYDWRRDNRAIARKLQQFIDTQLPRWQKWSGASDAKVILVGHSMGGLVARYYMEVLGGWKKCGGLITIGTPHRGAINGLDSLSNGVKMMGQDLTEVVRSLTSGYQLLPVYKSVKVNGAFVRPADTDQIPGVNQARARAAREDFHEVIRQAAMDNRKQDGYELRTIPWVGFRQDTIQSALVNGGALSMSYSAPDGLDAALGDGDGTVPRVSAIPSDWSNLEAQQLPRFSAEQHGWLTNNDMTLPPLLATVTQLMAPGAQNLFGKPGGARPAINLRVAPIVAKGEPVAVRVALADAGGAAANLEVRLDPLDKTQQRVSRQVAVKPDEPIDVPFDGLPPGLYRVEARGRGQGKNAPTPVHSVVEVVDSSI
jgi:pimeloyl-ACP methyl ester carboxylesterase